jgi:hypothetical protein
MDLSRARIIRDQNRDAIEGLIYSLQVMFSIYINSSRQLREETEASLYAIGHVLGVNRGDVLRIRDSRRQNRAVPELHGPLPEFGCARPNNPPLFRLKGLPYLQPQ